MILSSIAEGEEFHTTSSWGKMAMEGSCFCSSLVSGVFFRFRRCIFAVFFWLFHVFETRCCFFDRFVMVYHVLIY